MTCDSWWLWSLLLWTNHLYYVYYWVSLGWFYLLDIHCDYSFISPLCGVAQTPDCGIIISAFSARGVIQTLVWHQYYYFCIYRSRSHSDTRLAPVLLFCIFPLEESFRHSFGTQYFILVYFYPYVCIMIFFVYFVTDVWSSIKPGVCLIYYTRVLNVCEYIQTYSLACPWLLSWPDFSHGEERCDDSPGTYAMMIAASRR